VKVQQPNSIDTASVSKIVLIPVVYTERSLKLIPLVDAGIYNAALSASSGKQQDIMKEAATDSTDFYQYEIGKKTKKNVILAAAAPEKVPYDISKSTDIAEFIKKTCTENAAEETVFIVSRVRTTNVAAFGINGKNLLESTMYVYDKNGTLSGSAMFTTNEFMATAGNMNSFTSLCNSYKDTGTQLVKLLF
jgi:hypothetical protein